MDLCITLARGDLLMNGALCPSLGPQQDTARNLTSRHHGSHRAAQQAMIMLGYVDGCEPDQAFAETLLLVSSWL